MLMEFLHWVVVFGRILTSLVVAHQIYHVLKKKNTNSQLTFNQRKEHNI